MRLLTTYCVLLGFSIGVFAGDEEEVDAVGISDTEDGAKRALVLDAISQVTSTFLMAKQVVTNEELDSRIATFSDGVAKSVTITSGPAQGNDGLWRVGGKVLVVRRNLIDSLRKEQVALSPSIRSAAMFARAISLESLRDNSSDILDLLLEEDPRRYSARLVGEISSVPIERLSKEDVNRGGIHWVTAKVIVTTNIDAYRKEYAHRLAKILNAITSQKSRYNVSFEQFSRPKGYVCPLFKNQADVRAAMESNFQTMKFRAVTDTWVPRKGTEHIYKGLFMEGNTVFGRRVIRPPSFSSRVKWLSSTVRRPFVGYNVIVIGVDLNNYPTLNCYAVAPAFFGPFERLLQRRGKASSDDGSTILVSMKLINKAGEEIRDLKYPLPQGSWLTPAGYAGERWSSPKSQRVVLMPCGLAPSYCDAMEIKRVGRHAQKNIISAFNTVTNAAVTFRFPLRKEELGSISQVKIRVLGPR